MLEAPMHAFSESTGRNRTPGWQTRRTINLDERKDSRTKDRPLARNESTINKHTFAASICSARRTGNELRSCTMPSSLGFQQSKFIQAVQQPSICATYGHRTKRGGTNATHT